MPTWALVQKVFIWTFLDGSDKHHVFLFSFGGFVEQIGLMCLNPSFNVNAPTLFFFLFVF